MSIRHQVQDKFVVLKSAGISRMAGKIKVVCGSGRIHHLGWDTEGGDRAEHNLLRAPLRLEVNIKTEWSNVWLPVHVFPVEEKVSSKDELCCRFEISGHFGVLAELSWAIHAGEGGLTMKFACADVKNDKNKEEIGGLKLVFPFELSLCASTVIGGEWTNAGKAVLPVLISSPDHGEMLLRCVRHPKLEGLLNGSRQQKCADFILELPVPDEAGYELECTPVRLAMPAGLNDPKRWLSARRGWFNLLQVHAECGVVKTRDRKWHADPGAVKFVSPVELYSPAGLWANNVISNPVSSLLFLLGDHVLLVPDVAQGVSLLPLLRRTVKYWMTKEISPEGRIYYVENGERVQPVMDANPSVLIAAWSYVEASGDDKWLQENIEKLEFVARYLKQRDIDGDGLLESEQTGNSGSHVRPDCAWDTVCSGHKNAYVNALAYRAFMCLADLEKRLGREEKKKHFRELADRLKSGFRDTFFNPETGWLGWWRSQDGVLHDIYSDVPTSLAIMYGLISADDGKRMLDAYWEELLKSGFSRFDLGIPNNLRPISKKDQILLEDASLPRRYWAPTRDDGSDTFGRWLNGGCCVSNTYFFLLASYIVGNRERADMILDAMLERQHKGFFSNGGGFQNGVVDRMPFGAEFFEWDGKTSGYEGHLVYSWAFLQAVLLREPKFREKLFRPISDGVRKNK